MTSPELNFSNKKTTELEQSKESLDMEYGELSPEEKEKMEIVNEQFENPKFIEIPIPGNEKETMKIEYVVLDAQGDKRFENNLESNDNTVVNVAGFSASHRGPESFIKLMAVRENKRVVHVSMPGTGQSDSLPAELRKWKKSDRSFKSLVDVLNNSLDAIRESEEGDERKTTEQVSLVGVSMGAFIATEMAVEHPDKVKDLVLVHPSGVNEESVVNLGKRQLSEIKSNKRLLDQDPEVDPAYKQELEKAYMEMAGRDVDMEKDPNIDYENMSPEDAIATGDEEEIKKRITRDDSLSLQQAYEKAGGKGKFDLQDADTQAYNFHKQAAENITKDGKPSTKKNPLWRAWEAFTIAKGGMLKMLPEVKANTYIIYGGNDKLFPPSQIQKIRDKIGGSPNVKIDVFPGMGHDSIYQDARKYSSSIGTFLDQMAEKDN